MVTVTTASTVVAATSAQHYSQHQHCSRGMKYDRKGHEIKLLEITEPPKSTSFWRPSRWVSDSKTAPRFIKYNMLRSLGQQEEHFRDMTQTFLKEETLNHTLDPALK